ncbi:unnamed protein product (macronuclear) [Paramecium tetraurelia]|uniref:THH1/TOM1/TOM3 domain-containing protein n=1 Tax=Paramecium tetraurelia TaxID=5888 RepID=A0CDF1_PARTE|nr:uncharacterized protein GSPATT00007029001 [Paramecium tetraurelia]CAK68818.1 unnamed protein product [Paramecium tetraurelia]|eukprot:XP_001436215.1 hypothetical protein (macronuclear) [Paramecium tetraurelia strain d4-2]
MATNANGLMTCCQDFGVYCITLWVSEVIALAVLAVGICQLIRRKKQFRQAKKRKNVIYILIILCLTCNILFNVAQKTLLVFYFFQLYVYYAFLTYIVFYFARKTVKIKTFQPHKMLQLKIYCICLISLFTIFLIWNLYDYVSNISKSYWLCQKQIFHIIRMIGFIVDLVLIAVAHSLNVSIKKSLAIKSTMLNHFVNFEENSRKINRQRINFWVLVCVTFLGQLLYFIEDIYFLAQGPTETCTIYLDIILSEAYTFQYILLLLIVLVQVQLPFSITIYVFWFQEPTTKQESKSIEFEEDYFKTIKLQAKTDSNSSEQITTLKE